LKAALQSPSVKKGTAFRFASLLGFFLNLVGVSGRKAACLLVLVYHELSAVEVGDGLESRVLGKSG
jgi:hypothetical protein